MIAVGSVIVAVGIEGEDEEDGLEVENDDDDVAGAAAGVQDVIPEARNAESKENVGREVAEADGTTCSCSSSCMVANIVGPNDVGDDVVHGNEVEGDGKEGVHEGDGEVRDEEAAAAAAEAAGTTSASSTALGRDAAR